MYQYIILSVVHLFNFLGWLFPRVVVVLLGLMIYGQAMAGGYVAAGVGWHDESIDCPEVCFGRDTLARIRVGYEIGAFAIEAVHVSAPQLREDGYGLNAVFIDYKWRF